MEIELTSSLWVGDWAVGTGRAVSDRQMPNRHTNIYLKLKLLTTNLLTRVQVGFKNGSSVSFVTLVFWKMIFLKKETIDSWTELQCCFSEKWSIFKLLFLYESVFHSHFVLPGHREFWKVLEKHFSPFAFMSRFLPQLKIPLAIFPHIYRKLNNQDKLTPRWWLKMHFI